MREIVCIERPAVESCSPPERYPPSIEDRIIHPYMRPVVGVLTPKHRNVIPSYWFQPRRYSPRGSDWECRWISKRNVVRAVATHPSDVAVDFASTTCKRPVFGAGGLPVGIRSPYVASTATGFN